MSVYTAVMFLNYGIENLLIYLFLSAGVHHSDGQVCPQHACNWTTSTEYPFPLCYCDQVCHVYGDCCKDAPGVLETVDNQNSSDGTVISFDDIHCLPFSDTNSEIGFRVVIKCNEEFCFSDSSKIKSILPVTIATGKTYLNADCARCNGQSDYRFWDIVFIPNKQETGRALQNENTTNEDLIGILLSGKYNLVLNLDNITPPRFCLELMDVDNSCPNYLSPLMCETRGIERNLQCSLENKRVCKLSCFAPVNPVIERNEKTTQMSVLLRFKENGNLKEEDDSLYHMEIRNPSVHIIVSYWEKSSPSDFYLERFLGALYISLQHHSGYKFMSILSATSFEIETRNCSSYKLCYKYSFYFKLIARITEDRMFLQNLLNKEITLRYVDKDLGYEIPMATLIITNIVDTLGLKRFWFPIYSSLSGNFKSISEMRNCRKISISATINEEKKKADVETRCTESLTETNGQTASYKEEDDSLYHMEIRNPSVHIIVSYWEKSSPSDFYLERFLGALYISLQHHSGYKFMSILSATSFEIETRNCSSYKLCYKYSFYFKLIARITEDRMFLQNLLNKEITLRYVDKDLGYEIPMATLIITNIVDTLGLKRFWFPIYSSLSGNFKSISEMRNCRKISISATINEEKKKADVETRCTESLTETNGQTASYKVKWTYIPTTIILIGIQIALNV